ncbi:MAG: hypothetical protein BAJALOKI1v1_2110008 [Promethearchaeota archaeon]|nr:MAG: hypothetical protein BAJALOKI1v1_2110008 [Candidatus Lokiarchaeota archaeon]
MIRKSLKKTYLETKEKYIVELPFCQVATNDIKAYLSSS